MGIRPKIYDCAFLRHKPTVKIYEDSINFRHKETSIFSYDTATRELTKIHEYDKAWLPDKLIPLNDGRYFVMQYNRRKNCDEIKYGVPQIFTPGKQDTVYMTVEKTFSKKAFASNNIHHYWANDFNFGRTRTKNNESLQYHKFDFARNRVIFSPPLDIFKHDSFKQADTFVYFQKELLSICNEHTFGNSFYFVMKPADSDTFHYMTIVDNSAGTDEHTSTIDVHIYPNPVLELINVSASEPITSITVFDGLGRTIISQPGRDKNFQINTSQLEPGNYQIEVHTGSGQIRKPLLISK